MVKRLAILTTSLIAAAALLGGISVNADGADTYYPSAQEFVKPLTVASLTDYAVNGGEYAFAERGDSKDIIKVYNDGTLKEYSFSEKVTALDCKEGVIYYALDDGKVYTLPEKQPVEYVMPESKTTLNYGNYTYSLTGTTLKVADFTNDDIKTLDGEFSNLKTYGENVYTVSGNALYKLNGALAEELSFEYYDYSATEQIAAANTANLLKDYTLTFVTVKKGEYMTEIDLTALGESFKAEYNADGTVKTTKATQDTLALLLCYTGNAAIVAVGEKSYITAKNSTEETQVRCTGEAEFEYATVTGNRIYASPFVIIGTSALFPATGSIVKIINKIEHEVLGSAFYQVEYTVEGQTKTGYVTDGFLTEYIIEDNKEPTEFPDPEHSEKNDVRKVILIFLAVVLALTAIGYVTWVITSPKRKGKAHTEEIEK